MAKKKKAEEQKAEEQKAEGSEELVVRSDPTPPPTPPHLSTNGEGSDEAPSPSAPLPLGEGSNEGEYEVKSWAGKALFVCKTCKFDTFNEMRMLNHLIETHNSENALEKFYEGKKE